MKKLTVFILAFCYVLALCACSDSKQKEVVEYFFYGGNEQIAINNGSIVLSDTEDVFDGGVLEVVQTDLFTDITSYTTTFYTMRDEEQRIILSNSLIDQTGGSVHVDGELGKSVGPDVVVDNKVESMDELKDNFWFELKTIDKDRKENVYQVQLILKEITSSSAK